MIFVVPELRIWDRDLMSKTPSQNLIWRQLSDWFSSKKRELPWRSKPTPYRVWISEIMLQQTQVTTVIPYFENFMKYFPTLKSLATASEDEVLKQWAGLGYYSRARNLHKTAQMVYEKGRFPRTRADWEALPGIGPYTAGAILSISQNQPEAILDGNVERVLSRFFRVKESSPEKRKKIYWSLSSQILREAHQLGISPRVFNQALMELGALVCIPKAPRCVLCPLKTKCEGNRKGDASSFPLKKPRKQWKSIEEDVFCIVDSKKRVWVEKRKEGQWRAGLWDFPQNLPIEKKKLKFKGKVQSRHIVTHHKILRTTYIYETKQKILIKDGLWETPEEPQVGLGAAFKKAYKEIQASFSD
tara:strand:+ start:11779 stop:12852 length:1074 start_codon:yes stop_codon:yes gene_type:complete